MKDCSGPAPSYTVYLKPPAHHTFAHSPRPGQPGIVRDRIGDVLVQGEGGAQALVDAELAAYFEAELTKVGFSLCGGGGERAGAGGADPL
jgi:hypothetical protein